MSEQQDRLAAHERLSTGALASWMRACANHPWRVMIAWVGIIAGLILLVGDRRREPEGRVRDPGLRDAEGNRSDRGGVRRRAGRRAQPRVRGARGRAPRRAGGAKAAIVAAIAKLRRPSSPRSDRTSGGRRERRRPLQREHLLRGRSHRVRGGAVRPRHRRQRTARRCSPSRTRFARRSPRRAWSSSSTATPSSRRSSRERRSSSACSPRSSCCSSSSARSSRRRSRSHWRSSRS